MSALLSFKHVLILGLGDSGLSMARWCASQGAVVCVMDSRQAPPKLEQLKADVPQATVVLGELSVEVMQTQTFDLLLKSPGLAPLQTAVFENAAREKGISIGNELALFQWALNALKADSGYAPCVLAITGTNGKTTVTSLCAHLLKTAGVSVAVAGNIGPTLLDTLAEELTRDKPASVWVLELSSFQLDPVFDFCPNAAVVLNITQDHLDWHGSLAAYQTAKSHIFGPMTHRVLNRDDAQVLAMQVAEPTTLPVESGKAVRKKTVQPKLPGMTTFGSHKPSRVGDFGLETLQGITWLMRAQADDEGGIWDQRLMPADALRIRGQHNALNALAALALASTVTDDMAALLSGLRHYAGEPHRVQTVAIVDGVQYIDDSKGTNVGATVAALTGLGSQRNIVLIAGGLGKGQDFASLAAPVAAHAKAVLLIGQDQGLIQQALEHTGVDIQAVTSLEEAVQLAAQRVSNGDIVLLSPACASFDMFDGYAHRAQVFCDAVHKLQIEKGQVTC